MRIRRGHNPIKLGLMIIGMTVFLNGCGDNTDISVPTKIQEELNEEGPGRDETVDSQKESESMQTDADAEMTDVSDTSNIPDTVVESENQESSAVSIKISAIGDVTLGNHHLQDYSGTFRQKYDQVEDKSYFFENVYPVLNADDMTIANLEGTLTLSEDLQEGRTFNIKGDPEYAEILTLGSVEAVSMANNHRWDYGEEGCRDTIAAIEKEGIVYAYDSNVGIYETSGIRIGFVSVNEASQGKAVEKYLEQGIQSLKDEGVNLILACCHWGTEHENYPEEYQRQLGQKCIDWGADLVIGHHPHVLQGIEEYQGKYIVHSLGNFCFGANRNPSDKDTMIFQQTFTFVDGELQDTKKIHVIPCSVSSVTNKNDFRPTVARGEKAKKIIGRINAYSKDLGVAFTEQGSLIVEE